MSAADSVKQTSAAPDQKLYEPSMEEILASIRRIIADDQSLPGRISTNEEEDRLRAILGSPEVAPPKIEPPKTEPLKAEPTKPEPTRSETAREPAPTVRAIFAPHPVAPESRSAMPQPQAAPVPPVVAAVVEAAAPTPEAPLPPSFHPHMPDARIAAPQYAMPDTPVAPPQRPMAAPPESPVASAPAVPPVESTHANEAADLRHAPTRTAETPDASLFSPGTGSSVTAAFNTLAATRLIENDAALQDLARDMLRPMLKDWLDDNLPVLVERLVRAEIERVGRGGR